MKKDEKYFIIWEQLKDLFLSLSNKDCGLLITALSDYHFHGKQPQGLPDILMGMFNVLKVVTCKDFRP